MKKGLLIGITVTLLAVVAISMTALALVRYTDKTVETADEITVTFSEQGFNQRVTEVRIDSYAKNLEASVTYLIVNNTGYDITPSLVKNFHVNPDDYSVIEGQGYVAVPDYYQDWIVSPFVDSEEYTRLGGELHYLKQKYTRTLNDDKRIDEIETYLLRHTLMSGNSARYTIKLKIPGSAKESIPKRWAFQTVARSGTGGMYQVAPAVWWLVNMR